MKLTKNNYYSDEANRMYWSASFVKGMMDCPSRTIAELRGEFVRPDTESLLVGSYVDSYFEGKKSFDSFVFNHPEIFNSRTGELKKPFQIADKMIERAKSDDFFMSFMKGQKQKIVTGEINGIPFKSKFDVFKSGDRIVDLKTVASFDQKYVEGKGRVSFVEAWNWDMQMSIYQEIYRYITGKRLSCYIAAISKEDDPDIMIIEIPQSTIDANLEILYENIPLWDAMRQGIVEPDRCCKCAFCRRTNKLSRAVSLDELNDI